MGPISLRQYFNLFFLCVVICQAAVIPDCYAERISREVEGASHEMVNQANAPISSIMQMRFRDTYVPHYVDADGRGNMFNIDITMPLPAYRLLPIRHLTSLNIPVAITNPGPKGVTGFGDLRFIDLMMAHENRRLILGLGPSFVLPTASDPQTGQGKWQMGPAAGAGLPMKRGMIGVLFQNPISFAGDHDRPDVTNMLLQPFATYQLGRGWFVRSQPQMIFDWRTGEKILPLDLGAGRTFKIGRQNVNCFVQSFWNFSSDGHPPQYGVTVGLTFLYPNFWKDKARAAE